MIGLRSLLGCILIVVSGLLFYFVIPLALSFSLFVAWLVTWPIFLVAFIGCFPILGLKFKRSMRNWFEAMLVTTLPWMYVYFARLSIESKILTVSLVGLAIPLLYQFYLKHKLHKIINNLRRQRG